MMEENISLTQKSEGLSTLHKTGIGLFLGSCFALVWASFAGLKNTEWVGTFAFTAQLIGAILFTYEKGNFSRFGYQKLSFFTLLSILFSLLGFGLF
jgi:hypothetical protein